MNKKKKKYRLLTPELYNDDPAFFIRAIAYRLIIMFTPKPLTYLLPKGLLRPLLGMGSIVPTNFPTIPGWIFPPGSKWDPNWNPWLYFQFNEAYDITDLFPSGWKWGDPLPENITLNTLRIFPPGWKAGDQLPEGIIMDPGAFFPDSWRPGEPLPPGVHFDWYTILPDGWIPDNIPPFLPPPYYGTPRTYGGLWEPGPPHRPSQSNKIHGWVTAFDNTYWECNFTGEGCPDPPRSGCVGNEGESTGSAVPGGVCGTLYWDTNKWISEILNSDYVCCYIKPRNKMDWIQARKPTKMYIEWVSYREIFFMLESEGGIMASKTITGTSCIMDITWHEGYDIKQFCCNRDEVEITNIKFFLE